MDDLLDSRKQVLTRLRKVEGQIRGLQRMVEREEDCTKLIHQLSAARKALDKVGLIVLSNKMRECVERDKCNDESSAEFESTMRLFLSLS